MITRIDHIQLAAPKGSEPAAREFYGSILGLPEIEKPVPSAPAAAAGSSAAISKFTLASNPIFTLQKRLTRPSP